MGTTIFPVPSAAGKIQKTYVATFTQGWTVPAGVTQLEVIMAAGGGGGGGAGFIGAASGGAGSVVHTWVDVTPGESITISIGAGGNGGPWSSNNGIGADGGTSSLGWYLTVPGGKGGRAINSQAAAVAAFGQGLGGPGGPRNVQDNYPALAAPTSESAGYMGLGAGGTGGTQGYQTTLAPALPLNGAGRGGLIDYGGSNGAPNTGAGGGGAGGAYGGWGNQIGGNGGSGICIIKYWA